MEERQDLISRQDAIDLVKDVCDAIMSGCESWYDPETEDEVYKDIREVDAILKCNKEIRIALRNMPPSQPERIQNNAVHLCDSCQYTYVTCPSYGNDAVFGDGKGNDNICACNKYRPISAQPEQRWIPVSERLPDIKEHHVSEPCIVYCENGAYGFAELEENIFGQVGWNCERDDEYHDPLGEVIAWMSLPEPYREETE